MASYWITGNMVLARLLDLGIAYIFDPCRHMSSWMVVWGLPLACLMSLFGKGDPSIDHLPKVAPWPRYPFYLEKYALRPSSISRLVANVPKYYGFRHFSNWCPFAIAQNHYSVHIINVPPHRTRKVTNFRLLISWASIEEDPSSARYVLRPSLYSKVHPLF
jgi:hypothetical protein